MNVANADLRRCTVLKIIIFQKDVNTVQMAGLVLVWTYGLFGVCLKCLWWMVAGWLSPNCLFVFLF
jgi:hypothetical protein